MKRCHHCTREIAYPMSEGSVLDRGRWFHAKCYGIWETRQVAQTPLSWREKVLAVISIGLIVLLALGAWAVT